MKNGIELIASELWRDPSKKNWEKLSSALNKNGITYYKIFFEKGKLKKTEDLRNSYMELYNKKEKLVAKIPIFKKEGKGIEGATIYLRGLLILNS
jgi:hypothetical protein